MKHIECVSLPSDKRTLSLHPCGPGQGKEVGLKRLLGNSTAQTSANLREPGAPGRPRFGSNIGLEESISDIMARATRLTMARKVHFPGPPTRTLSRPARMDHRTSNWSIKSNQFRREDEHTLEHFGTGRCNEHFHLRTTFVTNIVCAENVGTPAHFGCQSTLGGHAINP